MTSAPPDSPFCCLCQVQLNDCSGQLVSASNPASTNNSAQSCQALAATILPGPAALTNDEFVFLGWTHVDAG